MTFPILLSHLCRFLLLLVATTAARDLYLSMFLHKIAQAEAALPEAKGFEWFRLKLRSCRRCFTTWLALGLSVAIWILPLYGVYWPLVLAAGIAAGMLVDRFHEIFAEPVNFEEPHEPVRERQLVSPPAPPSGTGVPVPAGPATGDRIFVAGGGDVSVPAAGGNLDQLVPYGYGTAPEPIPGDTPADNLP